MPYNVYSLPDVKSTIYHPDVGTANLHEYGIGKITISSAGITPPTPPPPTATSSSTA